MTTDEAIKFFEDTVAGAAKGAVNQTGVSACNLAIAALRAQREAKKNEPLTMEELRYMDGEPVYMMYNGDGGPLEGWVLVEVDSEDEGIWPTNNLGGRSEYTFDEGLKDGMTLYRRPPKEA